MAGDQPAKHALVSFHSLIEGEMGSGMKLWSFMWPFAQGTALPAEAGKHHVYPDGDSFPVLGQRGYFKALALFPLKPVLLSEDDAADDNPESQEMLEEQLVRLLTREVMDLISK